VALTGEVKRVRDRIQTLWLRTVDLLPKMRSVAVIRPDDLDSVFRFSATAEHGIVRVDAERFVLKVPQDADTRRRNPIFVAIDGWITFDTKESAGAEPLKTVDFGTHAAYFLHRSSSLEHVYGAHYDLSEDIGHPTFHAQFKSFHPYWQSVNERFSLQSGPGDDRVDKVLGSVRLPSAQMDIFSLVLQVCADHLISDASGAEAFATLSRTNAQCVQGAAYRIPRLSTEFARVCFRAHHWYSKPA
jgi:hypothetical protein